MTGGRRNFPKAERLRKRKDFSSLFKLGRKFNTPHLILFCRANQRPQARLGITASRKVGTAVARNRVKRLIREYYRQHKSFFTAGFDYSLVVKKSFACLPKKAAEEQLSLLLRRSRRFTSSRC
ncbi:MAG: ribonuclease P protein component [Deltaproteobacteria bacterium]|nr:ribonuclease P protein component [Deltaproteobacteria bacterium]